jgi:uncharacterized protein
MKIVSYDKENGTLIVEFPGDLVNDRRHEFYDVPLYVYQSLTDTSEPLAYFTENVWGNKYEKKVHWEEIKTLLAYIEEHMFYEGQVSVNSKRADGDTPLHIASTWGDTQAIRLLLKSGAEINAKGDMGYTPLHNAITYGHARCVEILLEAGADINCTNEFGKSALQLARTKGNDRIGAVVEKFL